MSLPDPQPAARKLKLRWYQYSLRSLLVAVTIFCVLMTFVSRFYRQYELRRTANQIMATVRSLEKKRPHTMTRGQWGCAMAWTEHLVGNSQLPFQAELGSLHRFQWELDEKTKGNVDMTTIYWIWDQHARLTSAGRDYQKFRNVMLDEIARVGPNDNPWVMNIP